MALCSEDERGAPLLAPFSAGRPRDGSTPRPFSRPWTPPIFWRSSSDFGSTSMASVEGFSVKGAGSVVSLDGSRWETSSSLPFFFFFFLSPSSSESLSVGSTTERSRSLPFEDQVPMLHFRLCFDGLSGTLRLLLAVVAPPASLWYDGGSWDVGDPSSLKWTEELVVSVGEPGARAPWLEGERWLGSLAGCWLTGVCGELLTASGDCGPSRSVVTICGGEGIVAARNELDALGGG